MTAQLNIGIGIFSPEYRNIGHRSFYPNRLFSDMDISNLRIGGFISDHALIQFTLLAKRSLSASPPVGCRAWRRLSRDTVTADLEASRLCIDLNELNSLSVDELA